MMPKLCFKTRAQGNTVQLVRHAYCPTHKRSQTETVGTLSTRADPADFQADLKLRSGSTLDAADHAAIANWLTRHGDPEAARYRAAQIGRIKALLQQELIDQAQMSVLPAPAAEDLFAQANEALLALTLALPEMAEAIVAQGNTPRSVLRPTYLTLVARWDSLLKAAQTTGIAKQYTRVSLPAVGVTPKQEDPAVA